MSDDSQLADVVLEDGCAINWRDAYARYVGLPKGVARPDKSVVAALKEVAAQVFELRVQLATQDKAVAESQRIRAGRVFTARRHEMFGWSRWHKAYTHSYDRYVKRVMA